MVLKRTRGYQDIDGISAGNVNRNGNDAENVTQEIEMASVAVVPDGTVIYSSYNFYVFCISVFYRYFYGNTSSECIGLRLVSSEVVTVDGPMLDG